MRHIPLRRLVATASTGLLLTACGTGVAPGRSTPGSPGSSPAPGYCPPTDGGAAQPAGCVPFDPRLKYQENHAFQRRLNPSPGLVEAAQPVAARAKANLTALSRSDRRLPRAVQQALLRAGLPRTEVQVTTDGVHVPAGSVAFGAFTSTGSTPGVCLYGYTDPATISFQVGGIVADGGCLVSPGGH
jgi:hypothetical protein